MKEIFYFHSLFVKNSKIRLDLIHIFRLNFQCSILRNGNPVQSVQITELNIIENLKFAPYPTSNKGLEIGSVGKIHCKVQGTPTPQIQWTKVSRFLKSLFHCN